MPNLEFDKHEAASYGLKMFQELVSNTVQGWLKSFSDLVGLFKAIGFKGDAIATAETSVPELAKRATSTVNETARKAAEQIVGSPLPSADASPSDPKAPTSTPTPSSLQAVSPAQ